MLDSARRFALLSVAVLAAACSSMPANPQTDPTPPGQSTIRGWQDCTTDDCGRNFVSAYSTLVFVHVDDLRVNSAVVAVAPGRHWIEAHYAWGVGVLVGVGNFRNYGFELEFLPEHQYQIREVPSGCMVPAFKSWVSPKVLRVEDQGPGGERVMHEVRTMEYCTPDGSEPGTCRKDADCRSGTCTSFQGSTGFGLCGVLRE